jgi:hypothetical protein
MEPSAARKARRGLLSKGMEHSGEVARRLAQEQNPCVGVAGIGDPCEHRLRGATGVLLETQGLPMKKLLSTLTLALVLAATGAAQTDDFAREGKDRSHKDPLEGKAPPALRVTDWMNTGGEAFTLESLRGKVVVLDFWGTW